MDFAARGSSFDPSAIITGEQFERWMLEWYDLPVKTVLNFTIGTVVMDEATYTGFLLKWGT